MNEFGSKEKEVIDYIMKVYEKFDDGNTNMPCPLCGTPLYISTYGEWKQSGIICCKTSDCLRITFRGL